MIRKITAERIFNGSNFIKDKVLIVSENGSIEDIVNIMDAGSDIERREGIISPGLINCHCHLELSHMKGRIPEKTGLVDFVFKVVTERHHSEEEILDAIEKAEDEMLQSGIVAVGDICNNELTLNQKKRNKLNYYNFIEASGWLPQVSEQRFKRALDLYTKYRELHQPLTIVPHAPYSVSTDLWHEIQPYFKNKVVSIHNQETKHEDDFFKWGKGDLIRMYELMKLDNSHHKPTGRTSLQSYYTKLKPASNALLVHNTFTSTEDIHFVTNETNHPLTFYCLCINANQYIEDALPPVNKIRKLTDNIVLGTDSLASNHSLNIMDEITSIKKHFNEVKDEELLRWATLNGAKALMMDDQFGSLEKGKKPGIIEIRDMKYATRII
jgi:cytosine/adenosine deaminase-related metal-dependent hydrolase